jgi:hypothetical protein
LAGLRPTIARHLGKVLRKRFDAHRQPHSK